MITHNNLFNNPNIDIVGGNDSIKILQYKKDLSNGKVNAMYEYYAAQMGVNKRQALIVLNGDAYTVSAGAMQWTAGSVNMIADVKGAGDLMGKALSSMVTKESAIKPKYEGYGFLMLEPTYRHLLVEDVASWGSGIVLDDGMYMASDSKIKIKTVMRSNLSSAVLGNEGMFNTCLSGSGYAILESPVPREELIELNLENDEVRIDGNYAVAWSASLDFRVEKSSKRILTSMTSGEGLVNVYRGTGKILLAPLGGDWGQTPGNTGVNPNNSIVSSATSILGGLLNN